MPSSDSAVMRAVVYRVRRRRAMRSNRYNKTAMRMYGSVDGAWAYVCHRAVSPRST